MAHHVESMDVDDIDSDFDNKENTYHHSNMLPRTPCTEKGYEELDVSELNMKLRYSFTPVSSPMSKSYTANCVDNKNNELSDDSLNAENGNLTRSFNSTMTKNDNNTKSSKVLPLQTLASDQFLDNNRNMSVLRQLDSTVTTDNNNITVTIPGVHNIDENLSLPSSSSSTAHTPEATTPTKEIPRHDGGSPIMRGLKSVFNMFRPSQSPIPPAEEDKKVEQRNNLSPPDIILAQNDKTTVSNNVLASTPVAAHKNKELSSSKRNSPQKDSIVFNDDLEKELQWKDETTIIFSNEKVPIHKLFFQHSKPTPELKVTQNALNITSEIPNVDVNLNTSVEYMDISYNDSVIQDRTMKEVPTEETLYKSEIAIESDSEFLDCETTFTKDEPQTLDNKMENNKNVESNPQNITSTTDKLNDIQNITKNREALKLDATKDSLDSTVSINSADLSLEGNIEGAMTGSSKNTSVNKMADHSSDTINQRISIPQKPEDNILNNLSFKNEENKIEHQIFVADKENNKTIDENKMYPTLETQINLNMTVDMMSLETAHLESIKENIDITQIILNASATLDNTENGAQSVSTLAELAANYVIANKTSNDNKQTEINSTFVKFCNASDIMNIEKEVNSVPQVLTSSINVNKDDSIIFQNVCDDSIPSDIPLPDDDFEKDGTLSPVEVFQNVPGVLTKDLIERNTNIDLENKVKSDNPQTELSSETISENIKNHDETVTLEFIKPAEVTEELTPKNIIPDDLIKSEQNIIENTTQITTDIQKMTESVHAKENEQTVTQMQATEPMDINESFTHEQILANESQKQILYDLKNVENIDISISKINPIPLDIEIKQTSELITENASNVKDSLLKTPEDFKALADIKTLEDMSIPIDIKASEDIAVCENIIASLDTENFKAPKDIKAPEDIAVCENIIASLDTENFKAPKDIKAPEDIAVCENIASLDTENFKAPKDIKALEDIAVCENITASLDTENFKAPKDIKAPEDIAVCENIIASLDTENFKVPKDIKAPVDTKPPENITVLLNTENVKIPQETTTSKDNEALENVTLKDIKASENINAPDDMKAAEDIKAPENIKALEDVKDLQASEDLILKDINALEDKYEMSIVQTVIESNVKLLEKLDEINNDKSPSKVIADTINMTTDIQDVIKPGLLNVNYDMSATLTNNALTEDTETCKNDSKIESTFLDTVSEKEINLLLEGNKNISNITNDIQETVKVEHSLETKLDQQTENRDEIENVDEEIIVSENNSPYVSVAAELNIVSEEKPAEIFEEIENPFATKTKVAMSPPNSPKIVSKGYNFNFDEIDDPFATKTKIRLSPPPEASPKQSFESVANKKTVEKTEPLKRDMNKNRRKSQPEKRKLINTKKNFNSTFDTTQDIPVDQMSIENTHIKPQESIANIKINEIQANQVNNLNAEQAPVNESLPLPVQDNKMNAEVSNIIKKIDEDKLNKETVKEESKIKIDEKISVVSNETKNTSSSEKIEIIEKIDEDKLNEDAKKEATKEMEQQISVVSNYTENASSSEQSTYVSAGMCSIENVGPKNVFNLPEIDTSCYPFTTRSKLCQSPPPTLKIDDSFATKTESLDHSDVNKEITNNSNADSKLKRETDEKETPVSINNTTSLSKTIDEKDTTVREVHTEDEDTMEGPFLEAEDINNIEKISDFDSEKFDMMQLNNLPAQSNDDNAEAGELFIDAEAFEFLMKQNKCNEVADSGKESLFLKFDPLFARRVTTEGVVATLKKVEKGQSTPKKSLKSPQKDMLSFEKSPIAASSSTHEERDNVNADSSDDLNVTVSKPMMVVTPAVNPVVSPRNKIITPVRTNRRSMTFTSPAIAVIDRLLSLSGNNSPVSHETVIRQNKERNEADLALTQLRELLAEKELHVNHLRTESKNLKDRLATLETELRSLEAVGQERLRKVNDLNERLAEKTKINKSMAAVVEEYERTIASLIAEQEQDKKRHAEERNMLIKERDEQTAHLASMEVSFNDLHSKYEKCKQVIFGYKAKEDVYRKSIKEFEDNLAKMQTNYDLLKQHATSKLNHANLELEKMNRAHEAEVVKLNAMIKRKELQVTSLEESLTQKTKANEELTAICDELINKVG